MQNTYRDRTDHKETSNPKENWTKTKIQKLIMHGY